MKPLQELFEKIFHTQGMEWPKMHEHGKIAKFGFTAAIPGPKFRHRKETKSASFSTKGGENRIFT